MVNNRKSCSMPILSALVTAFLMAQPVTGRPDATIVTASAKRGVVFIRHRDSMSRETTGTGFFVSANGYILTCAHVVSPVFGSRTKKLSTTDRIWVRSTDGVTQEAQLLYCDAKRDIAVLAIPGSYSRPYLQLSKSKPMQGEEVFVLGYPLGQGLGKEVVVTRGIVSALRFGGSVFQLDAATNPGNSGGPVLNEYGLVIGMAFAKLREVEGMNFAISAASLPSLTSMIQHSAVSRIGTVVAESTSIRTKPSSEAEILYVCPKGTNVSVTGHQREWYGILMIDGSTGWVDGATLKMKEATANQPIIVTAKKYLGIPYKEGGRSAQGLDAAGFVWLVFSQHGGKLPTSLPSQINVGTFVDWPKLQPGDRLFFTIDEEHVNHTGIYLGNGLFIHSSGARGGVAIDSVYNPLYFDSIVTSRR